MEKNRVCPAHSTPPSLSRNQPSPRKARVILNKGRSPLCRERNTIMHGSQGIKHPNKKPSITIHLNHSIIKLNMAIKVAVNGMSISLIELAGSTSINTNSQRNILESLAQITDGSRVGSPSVPAVEDEDA